MIRLGFVSATALAICTGSFVSAQSAGIPAEFPPTSFAGSQYVDSEGCAFIRAGNDGIVNWVPRVNRSRNHLCSFQPTFPAGTVSGSAQPRVAPLDAPIIEITAPPPQPRGTLLGLLGIGESRSALAEAVAPIIIEAPTPLVVDMPALEEASEPRRITLAQACAEIDATGFRYISAETGKPIICPDTDVTEIATMMAGTAVNAAPIAPMGPAAPASAVVPTSPERVAVTTTCENVPTAAGTAVRCGPEHVSGSQRSQQTTAPTGNVFAGLFRENTVVPASNPVVTKREIIRPPAGYQRVWSDGRLNPNRGLPAQKRGGSVAKSLLGVVQTQLLPPTEAHQ